MNFKRAALTDKFIGRLLFNIFIILPPYPKEIPPNINFGNILVLKLWGFGSLLEATPLFKALKKRYPDSTIDLLTFPANKEIALSLELFRKVYVIELRKRFLSFFWQTLRFIFRHRKKYSLVIDLEFFALFSALVTKMLGSRYSMGFKTFLAMRNRCYSRTVVFDHSNHVRKIFPILEENYLHIAVNINSSDLFINRRWPEDYFRKLIGFMQRDCNNPQIYLIGGREDLPM